MEQNPPENPAARRARRPKARKWGYMHMRSTTARRRDVLGFALPFSTQSAPATLTSIVERIFDEGVAALRAKGVEPNPVSSKHLAMSPSDALAEILREAGFTEADKPDEGPDEEPEGSAP